MEDGEVAFEFVNEVKLHFGQLGIIRGEGLDAKLLAWGACEQDGLGRAGGGLTKEHARLGDDSLDVDGGLLCLCGDIAAGGDDDEGVGLAVRVLDVEASEEDGGSRDDALPELEFLAELGDDCGRSELSDEGVGRRSRTYGLRRIC